MFTIILKSVRECVKKLGERGFTTQDVATGMTIATLVGSMAVVTANSIVKDTEEKAHIFNANTFQQAVENFIVENAVSPKRNEVRTYTLQQMYIEDKLQPVVDPSSQEGAFYGAAESKVFALNEELTDGTGRTALKFFVKLASSDTTPFIYVDHSNLTDPNRVEIKSLKRKHIKIPGRHS